MDKVVGIDLGTTFSAIAHINGDTGRPEVIPDPETQERITPSVVLFDDAENVIVGRVAKENAVAEPGKVVEFVKREMGKPKGDPPAGWCFKLGGKEYGAQEISAFTLKKLKQDAQNRLGQPITRAVITVPAYFGEPQRAATAEAGRIAGLEVMAILDEPVASALAYGLDRLDRDQTVFVFDLGGGTFDVVVIEIKGKGLREIAINGDHLLGGKDWDDAIIKYVASEFRAQHGASPMDDLASYQDLQLRAIRAKEELTRRDKSKIVANYQGNSSTVELTRAKFEEITQDLVQRCRSLCDVVLTEAQKTWADIDTILLVGGSTRMPMIASMVREISGKEPTTELNPDECVALGAAWHAVMLQMQTGAGAVAARAEWEVKNPSLVKKLQEVHVRTVLAHDLGVIALDESRRKRSFLMLAKHTPVPCEKTDTFATVEDGQRVALLQVTEGGLYLSGADCDPNDCGVLGEVSITEIPPCPAGSPIEVTYRFSEDKTLEVTGRHVASGKSARAEIKHPGGLTEEEMAEAQRLMQKTTVTS